MKLRVPAVVLVLALSAQAQVVVRPRVRVGAPRAQRQANAGRQRQLIEFYERELSESEKKGNWEAIARRLAPDFLEIAADGKVYNAQQVAEYFPKIKLHNYQLSEMEFRALGPNAALVAYRSDVDASFKGQRLPGAFRVSSVWARRNGVWLLKFHQATPVPTQ